MVKIILASKSKVRKQILDDNNISTEVQNSNLDEDIVKESLIKEKASPELISKNLAELKANKVSQKNQGFLVLGADSVIDLEGELISKPIVSIFFPNSTAKGIPTYPKPITAILFAMFFTFLRLCKFKK